MKNTILLFLSFFFVALIGCATNKQSREALVASTFVTTFALTQAVDFESSVDKQATALLAATTFATASSFVANYLYNDEESLEKMRLETEKLRAELQLMQNAQKVLVDEKTGEYRDPDTGRKAPGKYQLKYFKVDRLERVNKTKMIHIDREIEISPIDGN
jgi:hypothetical protein